MELSFPRTFASGNESSISLPGTFAPENFRTTLYFSGEYLRKGRRYSKLDKYVIYHDSSRIQQKGPVNIGPDL